MATAAPLGAWVAEHGGQVVRQVLLCPVAPGGHWGAAAGRDLAEVKRLFISPAARGLGLAQALMRAALAEAERRQLRAVLQTRADNGAANRFYERGGWQRAGTVWATWTDAAGHHPPMQLYSAPRRA